MSSLHLSGCRGIWKSWGLCWNLGVCEFCVGERIVTVYLSSEEMQLMNIIRYHRPACNIASIFVHLNWGASPKRHLVRDDKIYMPFCLVSEHGSCHGIARQIQDLCAVRLPCLETRQKRHFVFQNLMCRQNSEKSNFRGGVAFSVFCWPMKILPLCSLWLMWLMLTNRLTRSRLLILSGYPVRISGLFLYNFSWFYPARRCERLDSTC